jgi:alpha-L-arabinofuranosidase
MCAYKTVSNSKHKLLVDVMTNIFTLYDLSLPINLFTKNRIKKIFKLCLDRWNVTYGVKKIGTFNDKKLFPP